MLEMAQKQALMLHLNPRLAPPISGWYADNCWTMTVHVPASVDQPAGHLNFKWPNWTAGCSFTASEAPCACARILQLIQSLLDSRITCQPVASLSSHGRLHRQDAASNSQQPGVPAYSQRCCQKGLPHGGNGLLLHHVLRCGEKSAVNHSRFPRLQDPVFLYQLCNSQCLFGRRSTMHVMDQACPSCVSWGTMSWSTSAFMGLLFPCGSR